MSKKEKEFYCKLGQAVSNVAGFIFLTGTFTFYFVYALVH